MKLEHAIYCGDNLDWMKKMPDEFIDLCYIDPPFFSNKKYEVIFDDGEEIRSFEDRWKGGIEHYVDWMKDRVFEIHRILKKTGTFYLHCDWHASHYLKVMTDGIFGMKNLMNEIVWCYSTGGISKKHFGRKHDTLFLYVKDRKGYCFNQLTEKAYIPTLKGRTFAKEKLKAQIDDIGCNKCGQKGGFYHMASMRDIWEIQTLFRNNRERLGYPTQKPQALLGRIINASSNKGDIVFDPFCGCGTTLIMAEILERRWLGVDVSPTACRLMKRRLSTVTRTPIEIVGLRYDLEELKTFKPFEFQNWIIGSLGGTVLAKKVKDMGIDGYTFMERNPIQVKQSEHVGRVVVDNFETALRRAKKDKGIIVGFSFTKDAYEEVARVKSRNHLDITLMTVEEVRKQLKSSN